MAEQWPSELQAQRCREVWTKFTAEERRELAAIACVDTVAYLHDADEKLSSVDAGQVSRGAFRLHGLEWSEWSGDRPQILRLGGDFCGAADGMEFMLETCVQTSKELLDVARRARSGLSSFEFSWGVYAREFFSLVIHDMLGLTQEFSPRFLRRYHDLASEIKGAVGNYIKDVKSRDFPNEKEQYD